MVAQVGYHIKYLNIFYCLHLYFIICVAQLMAPHKPRFQTDPCCAFSIFSTHLLSSWIGQLSFCPIAPLFSLFSTNYLNEWRSITRLHKDLRLLHLLHPNFKPHAHQTIIHLFISWSKSLTYSAHFVHFIMLSFKLEKALLEQWMQRFDVGV